MSAENSVWSHYFPQEEFKDDDARVPIIATLSDFFYEHRDIYIDAVRTAPTVFVRSTFINPFLFSGDFVHFYFFLNCPR